MNKTILNIILLIIRVLVGGVLIWAAYIKLMNMDQTILNFNQYFGLNMTVAWMVAIGELLTGLGLLFGIWTNIASFGAIIIMGGAVYYSNDPKAIMLLIGSIIIFLTGSGVYSVVQCGPLIRSKGNNNN